MSAVYGLVSATLNKLAAYCELGLAVRNGSTAQPPHPELLISSSPTPEIDMRAAVAWEAVYREALAAATRVVQDSRLKITELTVGQAGRLERLALNLECGLCIALDIPTTLKREDYL